MPAERPGADEAQSTTETVNPAGSDINARMALYAHLAQLVFDQMRNTEMDALRVMGE